MKKKFGLIGLGFVSERHGRAVTDVDGDLVFGCDIDERKEQKFLQEYQKAKFYTNYKDSFEQDIDVVSFATPNHLHYPMIKDYADRYGKDLTIITEKPVCINSQEFKKLLQMEKDGYNIYVTMQLRYNEYLQQMRKFYQERKHFEHVDMKILVHRGEWYFDTWKGDRKRSGGLLYNIGVHYFDLLVWFFGNPISFTNNEEDRYATGTMDFVNASVSWELSIRQERDKQQRLLNIGGDEIDLSRGFEDLHTKVYRDIMNGGGIRPSDIQTTMDTLGKYVK